MNAGGALTTLYSFTARSDGEYPFGGPVKGTDGFFYGTTGGGGNAPGGGPYGYGTVFKISTQGVLTTLYSFTGGNDGALPNELVLGSDGYLYGTTWYAGTSGDWPGGYGTVFRVSTNGVLTSLYSFTGGNDGANPEAGLVQGSDGWFYGTTGAGGQGNAGTVFRLSIAPSPPVFQVVILTSGTLSLTWSTEAGGRYQLQYNSDLSLTNWANLGSPVTAAGATLSATDSTINDPHRFYRVVRLP